VLGSTALSGSVDNILILKRTEQQLRILSSVQRIGPNLEPTVVTLNQETGRLERAGSKREFDDRDLSDRIMAALRQESGAVRESWLQEEVEGRRADKVRVLRRLVGMGLVRRLGAGGRSDPYRYEVLVPGTLIAASTAKRPEPPEPQVEAQNPGLFADPKVLVPEVPIYRREQEVFRLLDPTVRTTQHLPSHVHSEVLVPEVPEVPDRFENSEIATHETQKSPMKSALSSGSQNTDYERF
jgi:hypothetical protein